MAEAVFRHLKDRIRNGELQPGDSLPSERELQAELGVSRISLREGLARLSALGLVEVSHGKGTIVSRAVSLQSVEDVNPSRHGTPHQRVDVTGEQFIRVLIVAAKHRLRGVFT